MPNYQNGLIYKLVCNDLNIKNTYYGSTTNFQQRKKQHKTNCNNINGKLYNTSKYKFIRQNGGWDNWKIIIIQYFPCDNKRELERAERYEMEQDNNRLNIYLPTRTLKEWTEDNKERMDKYYKEYRQNNKEQILEKSKEFYNNNKERILEYQKKNNEKIKERRSEKVTCDCGSIVTRGNILAHRKSKKHLKFELENK